MAQNETRLRLACGAGTLFFALGLCWTLEVILAAPGNHLLTSCCLTWRSMQFIPYLAATAIAAPAERIDLLVYWLLFTVQWFFVGTVVISRVVNYFISVVDLIINQYSAHTSYKVFDF